MRGPGVYMNDEKKSVDLRLLYDILQGLKALCVKCSANKGFRVSQVWVHNFNLDYLEKSSIIQ